MSEIVFKGEVEANRQLNDEKDKQNEVQDLDKESIASHKLDEDI